MKAVRFAASRLRHRVPDRHRSYRLPSRTRCLSPAPASPVFLHLQGLFLFAHGPVGLCQVESSCRQNSSLKMVLSFIPLNEKEKSSIAVWVR